MTLASFCIVKQSWHCFAHLIEEKSLQELQETIELENYGPTVKAKLPKDYADECDLRSEYDQIVAWFEIFIDKSTPKNVQAQVGDITVSQIIETIQQNMQETQMTYVFTDERCIAHADFPKKNMKAKVLQREG